MFSVSVFAVQSCGSVRPGYELGHGLQDVSERVRMAADGAATVDRSDT